VKGLLVTLVLLIWTGELSGSPASDLASPSPEKRDAAASILRATYTPPPQTNWAALLATLKIGDRRTNIEERLRAFNIKPGLSLARAGLYVDYRLDEAWILRCNYQYQDSQGPYPRGDEILLSRILQFGPTYVSVRAPTNFTGIWNEYYINGQKCFEINMKLGRACGNSTCFSFDGRKVCVKHHDPNSQEVEVTEYYLSGSVSRRGKRDGTGRPIGVWTSYNEQDGSIISTHNWSKP
jgi:hypothetical protein